MEEIRSWVEDSPYSRFLGVRVEHVDETRARLVLPYRDENSNPGKALHGGCAASLGAIGGQAVARAALGADSGPWHTAQMQVSYLAAAIGEDVIADLIETYREDAVERLTEIDRSLDKGDALAAAEAAHALKGASLTIGAQRAAAELARRR